MAKHGYTLVLVEPGLTPTEFDLIPGPEEVRSEKSALTTLIPLPNLSVYREGHGNGIEELTLAGTFGFKKRQVGGLVWSGAEMFLAFRKGFWDKYQSLFGSNDPLKQKVRLEYHNWDEDEHYYAEPTRFVTPRGKDNKTFFRYEFSLRLYAPIQRKFTVPAVDKLNLADRAGKFFKMVLETLSNAGRWLVRQTEQVSSFLNRYVLQPLAELTKAIDDLVRGVTTMLNYPLHAISRLGDAIAQTIEEMGAIVGDALTETANTLRNTRRMLHRLCNAPELFKQSVNAGTEELARQYYQLLDYATDSAAVQEEKMSGRNLHLMQQASRIRENSYSGAQRARIRQGDTLQKLAVRYLGDAFRWREIALLNGLESTELSLMAGQEILIPSIPALEGSGVSGDLGDDRKLSNASLSERLYGRDLKLVEESGKLSVVFGADNDLVTVAGEENLKQAVLLKIKIQQGQLLENPEWGMRRTIGKKATPVETLALKHGLEETVKSDPRLEDASIRIERYENKTTVYLSLTPVGMAGARPISAVVGL